MGSVKSKKGRRGQCLLLVERYKKKKDAMQVQQSAKRGEERRKGCGDDDDSERVERCAPVRVRKWIRMRKGDGLEGVEGERKKKGRKEERKKGREEERKERCKCK